ncbi:MAG: response regulator transcription factor [Actinomycetota bacterium]|nr:response regulator transcription factor [Actinomycetota bacterium]
MSAKKILVVEDEKGINELVCYNLRKEGLRTESVFNGEDALNSIKNGRPDLVLLDLMLPGIDGMDLCRKLKADSEFSQIPIIMLTVRSEEIDRVLGLELGADDYISKPFGMRELVSRVKAVLRRYSRAVASESAAVKSMEIGNLTIDTEKYVVKKDGRDLELSALEIRLLVYLAERPGKVFSRDMLLDYVWNSEGYVEPRTVDVHIRRIREKIEDDPANPKYIITKRGLGYFFAENS